jgi:hypothetical protein
MSAYTEFFLNSKSSIVELELLEISHSKFTQTYYIVRNHVAGVTVTHEDSTSHAYTYYPLRCSLTGPRDDLDHILRVEFGDLGEIIPAEIDSIRTNDGFNEFPVVKFRTYRSDVLTSVLYGPLLLEVRTFTFTKNGSQFEAKAPTLNVNKTGETYKIARFPMLRGVL